MNAVHEIRPAGEPAWLLRKEDPAARAISADKSGLLRYFREFGAAMCRFVDGTGANQRQIDKYLSESSDLIDLERRVRELDRNGWRFR